MQISHSALPVIVILDAADPLGFGAVDCDLARQDCEARDPRQTRMVYLTTGVRDTLGRVPLSAS